MKVKILEAVPAAGKTKAILEHIKNSGERAIVASISRQLSRQSYDYMKNNSNCKCCIIDVGNRNEYTSVTKTLKKSLESGFDVIFITHVSLLNFPYYELFNGYHLYIDEVPDMISLEMMQFTHNSHKILDYCHKIENKENTYYNLELDEEKRDELTEIATDGLYGKDNVSELLLPVYKSLLRGHPVKYITGDDGVSRVNFIDDNSNKDWSSFSSVTIACANFNETLTGYVLTHWNGLEFEPSELYSDLEFTEYLNTDRITIHVMVDSDWSKHTGDRLIDGEIAYNIIQRRTEDIFGNEKFIYTTNSYRSGMNGESIKYNPHGLNVYSKVKNIASLFSYNPQPWQVPILKELALIQGLGETELVDAFIVSKYLEPIFQLCTRGDIRNYSSNEEINLVVPDMRAAMYLKKRYLKDAKIVTDNWIKSPNKDEYNWKSRGISVVLGMNPKERRSFYYECKKNGKKSTDYSPTNPSDLLIVKNWLEQYRSKK